MNVLFLDQFSELGGAQRVLLETVDAIAALGWTAHATLPGNGALIDELQRRNVRTTAIPCGPYASSRKSTSDLSRFALDVPRQARAIAALNRASPFDLIYVNGPRLLPAAALSARTRVLFHAHSNITQPRARKLAQWAIARLKADVVACSNFVASAFAGCVPPENLHVVPNGVSEVAFRQRDFRHRENWSIGMLGRISPEKGQAEFLHAVKLVQRRLENAHFIIWGAPMFGSRDYFEAVQQLAHDLPVELRGWEQDLDSVFGTLDLLIVPSLEEGMGRVVVEAFSAGVPVIAFPTGGIPETIIDGETGFLTREPSPAALADRLVEVVTSDPELLRRIAAQARCAWERHCRVEIYQKRITDLMQSVAREQR